MLNLLRERPLESLICANPQCSSHETQERRGLSIRYWRAGNSIRYLHCHDCGDEFSERHGTPLFRLRIAEEKAYDVLHHLAEGCSVRGTSRLCKVKSKTVARLQKLCGEHFMRWHEKKVRSVSVAEAQLDEKWSFVGKKTEELRRRPGGRSPRRPVGFRCAGGREPSGCIHGARQANLGEDERAA